MISALLLAAPAARADTRLVLASTTSTENTGLFKVLLPAYYNWTKLKGIRIDVVAVGTGKAIEIGRRGDADILLVHDREKEDAFIKDGFGVNRRNVMYNDFVVVGPVSDPAGIKSASGAADAFRKMAAAKALFVSRGDESGTHAMEKRLWKAAGMDPVKLQNYFSVGQGMEETLRIADEKGAYTLSDRATYRTTKDSLKFITLLYEGDPGLFNQYGVMAVNPAKFPNVHYNEAMDFIGFVTGPAGQKAIGDFKDRHGNTLFIPDAD
ncbi:MAG: substrate-binding domain-containing protein [Nitrospirota bacterium]